LKRGREASARAEALSGMHFKKRKLAAMMHCAPHTDRTVSLQEVAFLLYTGWRARDPLPLAFLALINDCSAQYNDMLFRIPVYLVIHDSG